MSITAGIQGQLLEITVVGCSKLKDTEWISRQDPYVCVEYGSSKFRTRTCTDGGKNPTFQEKFVFTLIEGLRELNIVVWNSNTLTFDDFIGNGKVQLQKVLSQGYDDSPWTLHTKTGRYGGEVKLIMHYSNANVQKPPKNYASSAPPYVAPPRPQASPYSYPQPVSASPYSQPASSPYSQPVSASPYSQPASASPYSQPASAASYQQPASAAPYPPSSAYPPPASAYPPPSPYSTYPPNSAAYPPNPYPPPPSTSYPPQPYPPPSAYPAQPYPPASQPSPHYPPGPYPGTYPPPPY